MQLECPLCCGEKFACQESLRYHLLSMTVNIYCPCCNQLCDGISQLVDHLGSTQCSTSGPEDSEMISNIKQEDLSENSIQTQEDDVKNIDLINEVLNVNTVVLEDGSIMVENNETEIEPMVEDEEIYSCSSCGVNFTSIMEHIQQYHDGQEVVVEMAEVNEQFDGQESDNVIIKSNMGIDEVLKTDMLLSSKYYEEEENDTTEGDDSEEINEEIKFPQILNTLKQEECVDKDGRVYTRKVVQIEKFWDDTTKSSPNNNNKMKGANASLNSNRRQPICELFIMNEDGTMEKASTNDKNLELKNLVKLYNCNRCKMQFSKISQFNKHTCDPERASDYKCSRCEVSFNNPKSLCAHMKAHKIVKMNDSTTSGGIATAVAPFLCTKCDTVFPTNKSLRLHQRMHEPIKPKEIEAPVEYGITGPIDFDPNKPREMFVCTVCNKSYDKGYELIHMATHSGEDDYHCDICNRKFFTHDNLEMHMRVHNGGKPFSCSYCKNSFDTAQALTDHMEVHTKDRPYSCGYCGRKFARPHEKVKHERIHTGEKPHECEICGKTFRVSYCLTLHMRTHTGSRPYVCKHCGKRFKAHSVYNHHLLTHSDQRNYKCPYCPKAFKTGVQLAGHKNSHTKPFSCTECNRPFASLYAVRSHMESHKRENNLKFSCYQCGASYARNFALRDHIKEVHNSTISMTVSGEMLDTNTIVIGTDKVKIEELEHFKDSNSILTGEGILPQDNDETEMALSQLRQDTDDL